MDSKRLKGRLAGGRLAVLLCSGPSHPWAGVTGGPFLTQKCPCMQGAACPQEVEWGGVEGPGSRAEEAHVWGWGWTVLLPAARVAAPGLWLGTLADRVIRRTLSICEGQSQ